MLVQCFMNTKAFGTNAGDNRKNDLKQSDIFYVKLNDEYGVIKIELILSIIDNVANIVDCKLYNSYNSNFLCIKHIKKISNIWCINLYTKLYPSIVHELTKK